MSCILNIFSFHRHARKIYRAMHKLNVSLAVILAISSISSAALAGSVIQSESVKLYASDAASGDKFGEIVIVDGNTMAVSAKNKSGGKGAVYIFSKSGNTWTQQAKLQSSDPNEYLFGYSLALSGDTLAIRAEEDIFPTYVQGTLRGVVYVYQRAGSTWTQQARLVSTIPNDQNYYGTGISIFGDTLAVSDDADDESFNRNGALNIYSRSGSTWSLQHKFDIGNPAVINPSGYISFFGSNSFISGDTLITSVRTEGGSNNRDYVFVFKKIGSAWIYQNYASFSVGDGISYDSFVLSGTAIFIAAKSKIYRYQPGGGTTTRYTHPSGPLFFQKIKQGANANTLLVRSSGAATYEIEQSNLFTTYSGVSFSAYISDGPRLVEGLPTDDVQGTDAGAVAV